ncbi:glycoside hydrolase family 55 protein [Novosphingobium beihaiensis]|uniref:Glycoside hydrolase family 55 protein n=1 Tax=Novosphingobium beihaiensis TaxID=2930389 RepID=A0ABT0BTG6_9SPHN|nr:glycoside hydrolase family 55 protein [Novosphingobium beihaiensis]MCJ2188352.1 glycoside hydrolase family 55 protein [Novosphingobium beihaiensis]
MIVPAVSAVAEDRSGEVATRPSSVATASAAIVDISDYGADNKGLKDSAPALARAIEAAGAGGEIVIPAGQYKLSRNPLQNVPRSISIRSSSYATFAGPGAEGLDGFNHTLTNGYNTSAGPWQIWRDLPHPQGRANTTQGWAQELIGPAHGAASQVLGYMGADSNGNTDGGNIQEVLNLVQNVHAADRIGAGIYKPFEIDLNVDVSSADAKVAGGGAGLIGMLLTGGGAGGPYQGSGMQGILLQRTTGAWGKGVVIQNAAEGLVVNAAHIPVDIQTTYYGAPGDPACPRDAHPKGCPVAAGIVFSNSPSFAGTIFAGGQLANGNDTITIRRASDNAPSGTLLRLRNAADTADLASIDAQGEVTARRVKIEGSTVATLPACNEASAGSMAFVTDLAEPIMHWRQEINRGGGRERSFIACDGKVWRAN